MPVSSLEAVATMYTSASLTLSWNVTLTRAHEVRTRIILETGEVSRDVRELAGGEDDDGGLTEGET